MDFSLNEEQQMLKNSARDFLKSKYDKSVLRELEKSDSGHSSKLWKEMAKLDWLGIIIPEEYEGVGLGLTELAILFEELGRAAYDGPIMCTTMGAMMVLEGGSEAQKKNFLPKIASGKMILTAAVEEEKVSYDTRFVSVPAKEQEEGYLISGTKLFVPYAEVADYLIVAARSAGLPGVETGITLFVVDKKASGVRITPLETIAPDKQYRVDFDNVLISKDNIIGKANQALPIIQAVYDKMTAITCTEMAGGAENSLEMTTEYTKKRVQFDRPIGSFQAVHHRLVDMFTDVQGAKWTSYQAVSRLGKGLAAGRELAIAKVFTSEACQRVAFGAQQLHGGMGVDVDYDLHFYFRRAKAMELKFGTPPVHLKKLEAEIGLS